MEDQLSFAHARVVCGNHQKVQNLLQKCQYYHLWLSDWLNVSEKPRPGQPGGLKFAPRPNGGDQNPFSTEKEEI